MALINTADVKEKVVIKQVKEIINITGIKLQRINTGCFAVGEGKIRRYIKTAEAGTCDFEGYDKHGRFVAIECKRSIGGRLSRLQRERIEDINKKGGVAFVAHSGNEALALLQKNNCI
ncbi:MAG: VRR-NUC domain-containing protein [Treponema sp.]